MESILIYEPNTVVATTLAYISRLTNKIKYGGFDKLLESLKEHSSPKQLIITSCFLTRTEMNSLVEKLYEVVVLSRVRHDTDRYLSSDNNERLSGKTMSPKITIVSHLDIGNYIKPIELSSHKYVSYLALLCVDSPTFAEDTLAKFEDQDLKTKFSDQYQFAIHGFIAENPKMEVKDLVETYFAAGPEVHEKMVILGKKILIAKASYRNDMANEIFKNNFKVLYIGDHAGIACPIVSFEVELFNLLKTQLDSKIDISGKQATFAMTCTFAAYKQKSGILIRILSSQEEVHKYATSNADHVFEEQVKMEQYKVSTVWLTVHKFGDKFEFK